MRIGGFQKLTLSDFAGKPSCIVFTQGCNFRCPFCHNPGLVDNAPNLFPIKEHEVFAYLKKRAPLLSGVVITGGEPCIQNDLLDFAARIKDLSLAVKLDTNGSEPALLKTLLRAGLVDYIAMDLKAPFSKYDLLAGCNVPLDRIRNSIDMILNSGVDHEFRTTVVHPGLNREDILWIADRLRGAKRYVLQHFVSKVTLDPTWNKAASFSTEALESLCRHIQSAGLACSIR